ncbi:hypothetical protein Z042_10830 [Chania multitudinisentens RB-25]|uniref:Radical SAM core domain-containing protein n=1 Tax=Chania multitudinisentens RB-25 TaxID=1441930 RepID=W0LJZ6_9GAMM|nr:hypothetical protein Z042_10830 [Chania multitudinisentens RB-25]
MDVQAAAGAAVAVINGQRIPCRQIDSVNPVRLKRLTVQWHITDRCNLRCQHCYQDSYRQRGPELTDLKRIAQQVFELHRQVGGDSPIPLQLTLTGGEPCSHPDFPALLDYLASQPSAPSLAILSNGSAIDEQWAARFSRLNVKFVQLSLEGSEHTHDKIRGRGHFQQVITATKHLTDAGVRVLWSFTAHSQNSQEFTQVAELAYHAKVNRLWSDRMIPTDHRDTLLTLNAQQTSDYFQQMVLARERLQAKADNQTEVAMIRALQFQQAGSQPYRCSAGAELITIMPDGNILPCRRLPISVGNLWERPLTEIYHQAPQLRQLRGASAPQECSSCLYRTNCRGGLRCLAYAVYHDPYRADPACHYKAKE